MSPPLYLLRVPVRLSRLALYAGDRGWNRRRRADGCEADASFDAGRALHHVLDETFGPSALKPFRLMAPRERDAGTVYAYSTRSKNDLLRIANETSMPEAGTILALDRIDERTMPASWAEGKRLAFDVLIRPTVRLRTELHNPRSGKGSYKRGAEIDAYVAEAGRLHPDEAPRYVDGHRTSSGMQKAGRSREAVYRDWLAARLMPAAKLIAERTTMVAYERCRLARAGAPIEGPAATLHGELTIADPLTFATLLSRGVGRHKTYGFGMLLLRPLRQR
jgi:CRISPR system Cascade subunit CasE